MKTLQRIIAILVIVVFSTSALSAQDTYKHNIKNAKRVIIDGLLGELEFEGHNGNELMIDVKNFDAPPKRADGLRAIYGGAEDNTGVGLSIIELDGNIHISGATKQSEDATYIIKVPNSISLKVNYSSPFADGDIVKFENFLNEISVRTLDADISFTNVSGPITSSTVDGTTVAVFETVSQENPISISTIDGEIDVTIPSNTPADLKFGTIDGEVYTDFDIEFTRKNKSKGSMSYYGGGHNSEGTINGGGVKFHLKTIDGVIYLRKK